MKYYKIIISSINAPRKKKRIEPVADMNAEAPASRSRRYVLHRLSKQNPMDMFFDHLNDRKFRVSKKIIKTKSYSLARDKAK